MGRSEKVVVVLSAVAAAAIGYVVWKAPGTVPGPIAYAGILLPILLYIGLGSPRVLAALQAAASGGASGRLDGPGGVLKGLAALCLLWLPFELRLLPQFFLPGPSGIDVTPVLLLDAALCLFLVWWRLDGVGFDFALTWAEVRAALEELAKLALPLAGLGFALGFISWQPRPMGLEVVLLRPLGIYFLNALPEEFLFRGVMQNLLGRRLPPRAALAVTAVVFGLAHVNNPWPNWQYVAMATLAGWFYGRAYQKTGRVTASALVHTAVNLTWATLFHV